ncbi:MAG: ParB/RepB/Spo0J family partition protein, partial [Acidimicrobiales bacterium]
DFHLTHDELASRVGKSRAAISNTLRLFQLPPTVQRMVADGRLTAGHARALLTTPDRAYQEALAQRIATDGMSVRAVEEAARHHNADQAAAAVPGAGRPSPATAAGRRLRPPGILELEELLSTHLDTRVAITMGASKGSKGKVTIEFATLEDLERIYRAMTPSRVVPD